MIMPLVVVAAWTFRLVLSAGFHCYQVNRVKSNKEKKKEKRFVNWPMIDRQYADYYDFEIPLFGRGTANWGWGNIPTAAVPASEEKSTQEENEQRLGQWPMFGHRGWSHPSTTRATTTAPASTTRWTRIRATIFEYTSPIFNWDNTVIVGNAVMQLARHDVQYFLRIGRYVYAYARKAFEYGTQWMVKLLQKDMAHISEIRDKTSTKQKEARDSVVCNGLDSPDLPPTDTWPHAKLDHGPVSNDYLRRMPWAEPKEVSASELGEWPEIEDRKKEKIDEAEARKKEAAISFNAYFSKNAAKENAKNTLKSPLQALGDDGNTMNWSSEVQTLFGIFAGSTSVVDDGDAMGNWPPSSSEVAPEHLGSWPPPLTDKEKEEMKKTGANIEAVAVKAN